MQQNPKPENQRQEVGHIHQRDRRAGTRSNVVDAEVRQFEQECEADREKDTLQLSATIELSRQETSKRDQRKAERRERNEDALMRLDDETLAEGAVHILGRKEEFIHKTFLRLAKANDRGIVQGVEIERVTFKSEERKLARLGIELLAVSVHHHDSGAGRRIDKGAALGDDVDVPLGIAAVVDQQPGHLTTIVSAADVDGELVRNRGESPLLDQAQNEAVANLELQIFEGAIRSREEIYG